MWDYRFGGSDYDNITSLQKTMDGGLILGGWSPSGIGGDKSQPSQGNWDYWIVKTDSLGNKQWDKNFGGSDQEMLFTVQQTSDSGFILGGYSGSGISGDKTQPVWGPAGDRDFWIVKTDALGIKQWDKDFGGTGSDYLGSIQQTADGGYILGGSSISGISGDKTQPSRGNFDYWIVKIDALGIKQWDKDFGGTADDWIFSIQQTMDGGFILGGYSNSLISGDKSQSTWGGNDYWILKTDSLGNKQWDRDFGGIDQDVLYYIQQTTDSGFILGGCSGSGISGDKTQPTWGAWDYWIVKTDQLGNKLWDKDFGGTSSEDEFGNVTQTQDGGFLIAGTSYSNVGGDKSEANLGAEQSWIVKTDSLGNKIWDKTLLTQGHDEIGFAIETTNPGCYIMSNSTSGGIAGHKTQNSRGASDYWIIKFCETLQAGFTSPSYLCPGSCIDFVNLSFQATSFQWSFPGANPPLSTDANPTNICYSNPGTYDVQLIATNANGSDTLLLQNYITVYPAPSPQGITQNGDTLFAIAGAATYQWYFNGIIINGATDYFYVASTSGDYNVVVADNNGCEVEAVINDVMAAVTPLSFGEGSGVRLFPNPVKDKFTMHNAQFTIGTAKEISIYNLLGERVMVQESRGKVQEEVIDVSNLGSGIYYVEVTSSEKIYRTKFVKQ